jgi:hypothetical protein
MAKNIDAPIMDQRLLIALAATMADAHGVKKIGNINFVISIQ